MKTNKFRAWDGERMIYIADKRNDTSIIFNEWGWEVVDHLKGSMESLIRSWENRGAELMQFAGLLDKNGKEIYEGDILTYPNTECVGVVMFGEYKFGRYDTYQKGCGFYLESDNKSAQGSIGNTIEIIGNIHEIEEKEKP